VFSAVLIGGNIGGILGALLAVPVCAVLYTLLREAMEKRKNRAAEAIPAESEE
jgi:predicted PurR-regulated permease PerM